MYIVYSTINKKNGKIYIGIHNGSNTSYLGSGKLLEEVVKLYGEDNFIRNTLYEVETEEEAKRLESLLVSEDFVKSRSNYNLTPGGGYPPRTPHRPDASKKWKENNPVHNPKNMEYLKSTCVAKDKDGNSVGRVPKDDPRFATGEIVHINKGRTGWIKRGMKLPKVTCPHCGKEGGLNPMKRHHFDNCKERI